MFQSRLGKRLKHDSQSPLTFVFLSPWSHYQTCSTLALKIEIKNQSKQSKRPKTITTSTDSNISEALQKFQSQVCVVIASESDQAGLVIEVVDEPRDYWIVANSGQHT